jgi:2'-5' RNA ligase
MSAFLAWVPDEDARGAIAGVAEAAKAALARGNARHRWRRPDQWHMTLRHLGDRLAPGMAPRIAAHMAGIAASIPPHHADPVALDAWRGARVLVLRTTLPPPLAILFERIEAAMRDCGFRAEDRPIRPHITLAHLDPRHWPDPAALSCLPAVPPRFAIDRVRLLENSGTGRYRVLAEWALGGGARADARDA